VPRLFSRTPVVGTVYDVLPLAIPQFFRSDEERLGYSKRLQEALDRIDLLITVSEYSKREILRNFRVKVEPLVIYPARYPRTRPNGSGRDALTYGEYFLYVGGYSLRKGVAQLVRMFVDLHQKKRLSSRLLLTGRRKYPSEELKHLIEDAVRLNVAEELGYVSDAELFNLLSHAKALAYPSKYEGFGLPPLEAMSVGCPVLTSRCMSLPEVCGDAALYADPDDEREFAGAVMRLEHDGDLREALRAKGRAQAAKFSGRASAEKFLSAVGRLVGTRRSA
jgi:glycosyltransferase involved in cell wall biosynthesis